MPKRKKTTILQVQLQQLDAEIRRVHSRMFRWANRLDKLIKARARLERAADPEPIARPLPSERAKTETAHVHISDMGRDDLDIRNTALARRIEETKKRDEAAKAAILAEQTERKRTKSKARIEKLKAKQAGETGAMPLTGKAALAKINET